MKVIDCDVTRAGKRGRVILKKNCKVGSSSIVFSGVTIGQNAVVGAFSFVTNEILLDSVALGIPAKVIKQLNGHHD